MRYWWVNQNQTYRQELAGGYLWSPKQRADGSRNPFYEYMREVAPGDLVFSFANTRIGAFGVARSFAYEAPKPPEFGTAGRNWDAIGWRVDVAFTELNTQFRPAEWIENLRALLPDRYSPLLWDGRGVQSIYLTELSPALAVTLADLIGSDVAEIARSTIVLEQPEHHPTPEVVLWEQHLRLQIEQDLTITSTEREALVLARRGQGLFRERVQQHEPCCRVTLVDRPEHLRASHCKPWRDCKTNHERLDEANGLMLTPSIDHLFDRGFISFTDEGILLVSPVAHRPSLHKMGVPVDRQINVGSFRAEQRKYLDYHRDLVFLKARLGA